MNTKSPKAFVHANAKKPKRQRRIALVGIPMLQGRSVFNGALMRYAGEEGNWQLVASTEATIGNFHHLRSLDCDGAIVRVLTPEMSEVVQSAGFPVVNVSSWLEEPGVATVRCDQAELGRLCAMHLLAKGFRRFGCVRIPGGWFIEARLSAFLKTLETAGYPTTVDCIELKGLPFSRADLKRFWGWVATLRTPAALFLSDGPGASNLMDAVAAVGLRIPHDIAVIAGYHNEDAADWCVPPLTFADQDSETWAIEAAKYLDRLMRGDVPPQKIVTVPARGVVACRSTDTVAVDDPIAARAIEYIRENLSAKINVKVLADLLGIRRRTLDRHFRTTMAMSLNEFLVGERAEKARTLLRAAPPLSLREIARRCGFSDTQHMKKVLRRSGIARDFGRRPGRPAKAGAERSQGT